MKDLLNKIINSPTLRKDAIASLEDAIFPEDQVFCFLTSLGLELDDVDLGWITYKLTEYRDKN